jgi:hypothetical protein
MKWKGIVMAKKIGIIAVGIALGVTLFFFGLLVLIWSFTIGSSILGVLFGGFGCFQIFMGTIVVGMLFEERRQERIVASGAVAISVTLLFFGFFFFIVGVWGLLFAYGGLYGLSYLLMLFGGSTLATGIIIVLKLVEPKKRKWIITARIASSATLFFIGSLFLICSFVLGSRIGVLFNSLALSFGGFGSSLIAAGIIIVLKLVEARKRKLMTAARIASGATLFFVGLSFLTSFDLIWLIIGGPMIIAGTITLLRTVR